jgi:hypothetical protein
VEVKTFSAKNTGSFEFLFRFEQIFLGEVLFLFGSESKLKPIRIHTPDLWHLIYRREKNMGSGGGGGGWGAGDLRLIKRYRDQSRKRRGIKIGTEENIKSGEANICTLDSPILLMLV